MDRNSTYVTRLPRCQVALRKESVDRNILPIPTSQTSSRSLSARRAWIEIWLCGLLSTAIRSLSARRAWIEMCLRSMFWLFLPVALRKESVDRNPMTLWKFAGLVVALRKESVDRNMLYDTSSLMKCRRSPQGERG